LQKIVNPIQYWKNGQEFTQLAEVAYFKKDLSFEGMGKGMEPWIPREGKVQIV
jgi:hypothetical protein